MPDGTMFSPRQIATRLGVHIRTVHRWIKSGRLHAQRIPGRGAHGIAYRVSEEDLQAFLAGQEPAEEAEQEE